MRVLLLLNIISYFFKHLKKCPIHLENNYKYYFHLNTRLYIKYKDLNFKLKICDFNNKNNIEIINKDSKLLPNLDRIKSNNIKIFYKVIDTSTERSNNLNTINIYFKLNNYFIIVNGICKKGSLESNKYAIEGNRVTIQYNSIKFCEQLNYGYYYLQNYKYFSVILFLLLAIILSYSSFSFQYNLKFIQIFYSLVNLWFLVIIFRHYLVNSNTCFTESLFLLVFFSIIILLYLSFKHKIFRAINPGFMFFITYEMFIYNSFNNTLSLFIFFIICMTVSIFFSWFDHHYPIIFFSSLVSAFILYFTFNMIIYKDFLLNLIYENNSTIGIWSYIFIIIVFIQIYLFQFYNYHNYILIKKIKQENKLKIRSINMVDH